MIRKIHNAASGLSAQAAKMDIISHNVANMNTIGYKKKEISFEDLLYREMAGSSSPVAPNAYSLPQGQGVKPAAVTPHFKQGILRETGREQDFAIEGEGMFRLRLPHGETAYTRAGAFYVDENRHLVCSQGYRVEIEGFAQVDSFASMDVNEQGMIVFLDEDGHAVGTAQLLLYRFLNQEGLMAIGENLWQPSANSGALEEGAPGGEGFGKIRQRYLEEANVNLIEEMAKLMLAQRSFQINSRSVQTGSEMWELANNIRR